MLHFLEDFHYIRLAGDEKSVLDEIGDDLRALSRRRALLLRMQQDLELIEITPHAPEEEFVETKSERSFSDAGHAVLPRIDSWHGAQSVEGYTTSSRRTLLAPSESSECTFTPSISMKSRQLASKLNRDPSRLYHKTITPRSASAVIQMTVPPPSAPVNSNPVTEAIVSRIKQLYGSIDEYHKSRRENSQIHKAPISRHAQEFNQCTFKPRIAKGPKRSTSVGKAVAGNDSFVQRQERARELKQVETVRRPGCGEIYTGVPTKVEPFSFINKTSIRE